MSTSLTSTKKSGRAKKITLDQAEADKKRAIDEALKEQKKHLDEERIKAEMNTPDDAEFEDEYEDSEDDRSFGTTNKAYYEEPLDSIEEPVDIMQFGADLEEQGKDVSYYIKKDGAFVTELYSHIPMNEFQKRWGGGKYTVSLKNGKGQWIKQATFRVDGPQPKAETETKQKETYFPPQPQMPQIDLNSTFQGMSQMFMQMQEMVQREKSRGERDEKKSSDSFNTSLFQVMQQQSTATQQMIMEMQRNNMEMMKSISENQTRTLEKAEDRNREMIKELKASMSTKDQLGLKDMLAMLEASRNNGMDTMKTVMELSETMADLRTPAEREIPDTKDSMLSKLVTAFVPLLTKANQASQMPGVAPQVGVPNQLPRRMVQQAGTPQAPQAHPAFNPQGIRRQQTQGPQNQASPIKGNGVYQESFIKPEAPKVQKMTASSLGLPTFADKRNVPTGVGPMRSWSAEADGQVGHHSPKGSVMTQSSEELIKQTQESLQKAKSIIEPLLEKEKMTNEARKAIEEFKSIMPFVRESDIYKKASPAQKNIVEIGLPIISQYINNESFTGEMVAHFVIDDCEEQGFTAEVVSKEFTFDFLLQIASNFGIAEDKNDWFGEFYETIKETARSRALGNEESATGDEQ